MCACTNNITEYKQNYFGIYTKQISIAFASLIHLKLPISIEISVTIPQNVNNCIKFAFINYQLLTFPTWTVFVYIFVQNVRKKL